MNMEKKIEEMERDLIDSVEHETLFDVDFYTTSKNLIAKGYRKVVLCKNCVCCNYGYGGDEIGQRYNCSLQRLTVLPTDFCSMGKMKGE